MSNDSRLCRPQSVTGDGAGLTSRGGLVVLDEVAAGLGLADGLAEAFDRLPHRVHRPGRSILATVLALADGAECVADVAAYADQPAMFGHLPSEATLWRTFENSAVDEFRGLADACRDARATAWAAGAGPDGEELMIDIDATIVPTRADKQDAAGTYKRSHGHHPLVALAGDIGEVLALQMRPGNAGSNTGGRSCRGAR